MMIKYFLISTLFFVLATSCTNTENTETVETVIVEEQLIEQTREWYREYYPGKKQLKIIGTIDDQERRHGVWEYYNEDGVKISATYYLHGKKDGYSVVYHPNGATSYVGEYKDDKKIGVWRIYDPNGNLITEKEF